MDLKRTILDSLDTDQLLWYVDAHRLDVKPRGRRAVIEALQGVDRLTPALLLEPLYEVDVKRICVEVGVEAKGRRRALIQRLLGECVGLADAFVAIDFETADQGRDSACAVALVRVEGGRIVRREVRLIRPPRRSFEFTYIHGITWERVRNEAPFREVWPQVRGILEGARFLAAHNASFDRSVLEACCRAAGLEASRLPYECTVKMARRAWGIYPTKLPDVCRHLGIGLVHHDAGSDAEACARIVVEAERARVGA